MPVTVVDFLKTRWRLSAAVLFACVAAAAAGWSTLPRVDGAGLQLLCARELQGEELAALLDALADRLSYLAVAEQDARQDRTQRAEN